MISFTEHEFDINILISKKSGKKFKSGKHVEIATDLVINPHSNNFAFVIDGDYENVVDVSQVKAAEWSIKT